MSTSESEPRPWPKLTCRNMTAHEVLLLVDTGDSFTILSFPPDPAGPAEVGVREVPLGIVGDMLLAAHVPVVVRGLPPEESGTVFIVAPAVREFAADRFDLVSPGAGTKLIRSATGERSATGDRVHCSSLVSREGVRVGRPT